MWLYRIIKNQGKMVNNMDKKIKLSNYQKVKNMLLWTLNINKKFWQVLKLFQKDIICIYR